MTVDFFKEGQTMIKYVNQSDFSKIVGVTKQRISKSIQHGKLSKSLVMVDGKRMINLKIGLQEWAANIAPVQQIGGSKNMAKKTINQMNLSDLQLMQARYKTLTQKLDLDTKIKGLIPVEQIEKEYLYIARIVREVILAIPDRISAILAAETSERKVNNILTEKLHEALEGLKNA